MKPLRIAFVMSLGNPIGLNWVLGIKRLGFRVVVIDQRREAITKELRAQWGIPDDLFVVKSADEDFGSFSQLVSEDLGGEPEIVFGWWGVGSIPSLMSVSCKFPSARVVLCLDTFPDAWNGVGELLEYRRYRDATTYIDGFIHYSNQMKSSFLAAIPAATKKDHLVIVEPFLREAFDNGRTPTETLERFDDAPHVIFTGRTDHLWSRDPRMKKDAMGKLLYGIADRGIHVFLSADVNTRIHPKIHNYTSFSNTELFDGTFSSYVSQFDAHLVAYNEFNRTIRKRVSNGLSTRFAFALTAHSPIAVTKASTFVREYWGDRPLGFEFSSVENFCEQMGYVQNLLNYRAALEEKGHEESFEEKATLIETFLRRVAKEGLI